MTGKIRANEQRGDNEPGSIPSLQLCLLMLLYANENDLRLQSSMFLSYPLEFLDRSVAQSHAYSYSTQLDERPSLIRSVDTVEVSAKAGR